MVASTIDAPKLSQKITAASLVGLSDFTSMDIHDSILAGFPYKSISTFKLASTLKLDTIRLTLALKKRQLVNRKKTGRLTHNESERLYRLATVFEHAMDLFEGDIAATVEWLNKERSVLGGRTPLEMTTTNVGANEVLHLIGRLEHGIFS